MAVAEVMMMTTIMMIMMMIITMGYLLWLSTMQRTMVSQTPKPALAAEEGRRGSKGVKRDACYSNHNF